MVENVFDTGFVMSSHDKYIKETTTAEKEQLADDKDLLEVSRRLINQKPQGIC